MPPDIRQQTANTLYANLMDEAKVRISCVQDALNGRLVLPAALNREIGFLQLRMLCELIALCCLTAHGDITAKSPKLSKEFAADRIIQRLAGLHPNFYPYPVRLEVRQSENQVILHDQNRPYLTKEELPRLYARCGEMLHRGTIRKLASTRAPEQMLVAQKDFGEIATWTNKIVALIDNHRISSIDNTRHLIVILSNASDDGKVQVAFAQSPPLPR